MRVAASVAGVDVGTILMELGHRKMVGGQEDRIVDVALDMVRDGRWAVPTLQAADA